MKREIKFRAWDGEQMLKYAHVHTSPKGWVWMANPVKVGVRVVMQFTGLLDKNKKEIYEGDILKKSYSRDTTGKDIVEFVEVVEHEINIGKVGASGFEIIFLESAEIVGNIYEHPHLLNSDKNDERSVETDAK